MNYIIITPKQGGEIKAIPLNTKTKRVLQKGEHSVIAQCESKEKAQGFIMGLKAHTVVEKYAGHLPSEMKTAFKTEIAQLATSMYNEIIK